MNAAASSRDELAAVRHLTDLGYVDPLETAGQRAASQREQAEAFQRTESLLGDGDAAAAIHLLEALVPGAPDWTAGRHLLARAHFRSGNYTAVAELLDWLELHAVEHAELACMRAAIAASRRQWRQARDDAEYAIHLAESLPAAQLIVADVQRRFGELESAEANYRALEATPQKAAARIGLASIALGRGAFEDAAALALDAIEVDPKRWEGHWLLGRALMGLQRWSEARIGWETCVRMRQDLAPAHRRLAQVYAELGDTAASQLSSQNAQQFAKRRRAKNSPVRFP